MLLECWRLLAKHVISDLEMLILADTLWSLLIPNQPKTSFHLTLLSHIVLLGQLAIPSTIHLLTKESDELLRQLI